MQHWYVELFFLDDEESSGSETSVNSQDYDDVSFDVEHEDTIFTEKLPNRELELLGCEVHQTRSVPLNGYDPDEPEEEANIEKTKAEITVTKITGRRQPTEKHKQDGAKISAAVQSDDALPCVDKLLDILDSKWIYFCPLVSSATFFASAIEISPLYLILSLMVVSCVMFYVMLSEDT